MKRWLIFLMMAALLLTGVSAAAEDTEYQEIRTAADLQAIRNNLSGKYILMNNITLKRDFSPLAPEEDRPFTGVLDGNGRTISGLTVRETASGTAVGGLFGYNAGTVQDLTVRAAEIDARSEDRIGGAYTYAGIIAADNRGRILRCSVEGSVRGESRALTAYAGGIAGVSSGQICCCAGYASVYSSGISEGVSGGICGWNQGEISDCYFAGSAETADAGEDALLRVGGIAGKNGLGGKGTIARCHSIGGVSAKGSDREAGGISGNNLGKISDCFYAEEMGAAVGSTGEQTGARSRAEMKDAASFPGWDFSHTWRMAYYPMLQSIYSFAPTLPGDVNLSGTVQTADAVLVLQRLSGREVKFETIDADMNFDRRLSVADAVLILQKIAA